jgi:uncharacterized protein (TIGR02453 family)
MAFRGWPVEALEFFEALEAENTKSFWEANRSVYQTSVRAPMESLLEELEPEWGEGRIFRPYRDVRFSGDKTPYKTQIGAMIGDGYVQVDAEGLAAGCGMWEMAADQLERFRTAVADDRTGGRLETIVASARAAGLEVTVVRPEIAPRVSKDHPHRASGTGLITWREYGRRVAGDEEGQGSVDGSSDVGSAREWLRAHVGLSTLPVERRR